MSMSVQYRMSQLITERRTIRKFKEDSVSTELISELLEVASYAPNHKLKEPWRFVIFNGKGKEALADLMENLASKKGAKFKKSPEEIKKHFSSVPAHLVVIMPEDPQPFLREEDYAANCALIQNFQLAAWERGIGALWKTDSFITLPEFRDLVGAKPGEKVVAILHIGYPEVIPTVRTRTPIAEKLTVIDKNEVK